MIEFEQCKLGKNEYTGDIVFYKPGDNRSFANLIIKLYVFICFHGIYFHLMRAKRSRFMKSSMAMASIFLYHLFSSFLCDKIIPCSFAMFKYHIVRKLILWTFPCPCKEWKLTIFPPLNYITIWKTCNFRIKSDLCANDIQTPNSTNHSLDIPLYLDICSGKYVITNVLYEFYWVDLSTGK